MMHDKLQPMLMLLIDDDEGFAETLNRDAQEFNIFIKHTSNLEDARKFMESPEGRNISGVILDVICLKEKAQRFPDKSFILVACKYFGEKAPHLPVVILTGEPDQQYADLKELFRDTLAVYSKGRDENAMFSFLKLEATKIDRFKIKVKYSDIFETIEQRLGVDAEDELINCIRMMNSNDPTTIRNTLGCLRRLQEKIYIAINQVDKNVIPTNLVHRQVKVSAIHRHLTESGVVQQNKIISRFAELIYKISCEHGAHSPITAQRHMPSQYTVQALIFALLDLILWLKSFAQEKAC